MLTRHDIGVVLREQRVRPEHLHVWGLEYSLPDRAWITGEFSRFLRLQLLREGLGRYDRGSNRCQQFAFYAWVELNKLFHCTGNRRSGRSLAAGVARFWPDGVSEYHALVFALVPVGSGHGLVWLDVTPPETAPGQPPDLNTVGRERMLNETEIDSVDFVLC